MARLESVEQAFYGDRGVVDLLVRLLLLDPVRFLAAVSVDAEAHVVDVLVLLPFHRGYRKVLEIRIKKYLLSRLLFDIVQEVISRAVAEEVDIVIYLIHVDMVYEIVDGSVSSDKNDLVIRIQPSEELFVIKLGSIDHFSVRNVRFYPVVCLRVVQIVFHEPASFSVLVQPL